MRRAVGVARVQQQQQTQQRMADLGAQITAERVAHIADQLELLESQLRTLARKYKDDIKHDPVVRARFRQIADSLGVDLISSKKNVFAGVLGLGDFYYRLAGKLIEACMREEAYCGGYVPLQRVMQRVQQSYDAATAAAAATEAADNNNSNNNKNKSKGDRKRTTLSVEDVLTALSKLRVLGSGYSVVDIQGTQYIQTASADSATGGDVTALLGVVHALRDKQVHAAAAATVAAATATTTTEASATSTAAQPPRRRVGAAYVLAARGNATMTPAPSPPHGSTATDATCSCSNSSNNSSSDAVAATAMFAAQCVAVTEAQLCEALPWPLHRLRAALQRAVQSGIAWVDRNDDFVTATTTTTTTTTSDKTSASDEQAWLPYVVYWFMPALAVASDSAAAAAVVADDVGSPVNDA